MRPNFEKAQNTATKLLLEQDIHSLFTDVRNFGLPLNITIDSIQNFCALTHFDAADLEHSNIDGACSLHQGSQHIVLYDELIKNERRKHWGIVHELGHIYLGHNTDDKEAEVEANFFAAQLIAPEIILCEIIRRNGSICEYDIYAHFNASYAAAEKRIETLKKRSRYNNGTIDKQLLEKYEPILDREFPRCGGHGHARSASICALPEMGKKIAAQAGAKERRI